MIALNKGNVIVVRLNADAFSGASVPACVVGPFVFVLKSAKQGFELPVVARIRKLLRLFLNKGSDPINVFADVSENSESIDVTMPVASDSRYRYQSFQRPKVANFCEKSATRIT